jgi:hypothetical protein
MSERAFIRGLDFNHAEVEFEVIDGNAILEGDIVLGPIEKVRHESAIIRNSIAQQSGGNVPRAIAITGKKYRWPGGVVPYAIDSNLPQSERVASAIKHWEVNTRIRFISIGHLGTGTVPHHILFKRDANLNGGQSSVGMNPFPLGIVSYQSIDLGDNADVGTIIHEIGHAVGLWHEQSRSDRDNFVTVNWGNIVKGKEHNFNTHEEDGDNIGPYDYGSIMHYARTAFSSNGQDTITPVGGQAIGQRSGLSSGDKEAVAMLYGGPNNSLFQSMAIFDDSGTQVAQVPGTPNLTLKAGRKYRGVVKLRNFGATVWTVSGASPYKLGSRSPSDNTFWGTSRVSLVNIISPGDVAVFDFQFQAPSGPFSQSMQWQMVQESIEWFGDFTPELPVRVLGSVINVRVQPYPVPVNRLVNLTVFATDQSGNPIPATVYVRNPPGDTKNFPANQPFQWRFMRRLIEQTGEFLTTTGVVRAPGYNDVVVDWGLS